MSEQNTIILNTIEKSITKDQIKALRTADNVCFHYLPGGECYINAIKSGKAPWYQEKTVKVICKGHVRVHGEDFAAGTTYNDSAKCFEMIHGASTHQEWQTVAGLLKEGDVITLDWVGSDNNGYVKRSAIADECPHGTSYVGQKIHHDHLYVRVTRKGETKFSFLMSDQVGPNNTARMIQV